MEKSYADKLKDPLWLAKRREILERDNFTCQSCGDQDGIMQVHHEFYFDNTEPYDYPNSALVTLCKGCHEVEERNRKQTYKNLCTAIADAGFTREDVEKLTWTFRNINVKPMFSGILTSLIHRGIMNAWHEYIDRNEFFICEDEETEIRGTEGIKTVGELVKQRLEHIIRYHNG